MFFTIFAHVVFVLCKTKLQHDWDVFTDVPFFFS